ncbi:MAG TPA: hypothetical protein PK113_00860 [Bacillota bacterium]|nr:hypothetical protein [Bacillota bacterium]
MKRNILKNIKLDSGEKIFKDFRKLNAKGFSCQILLTTKRIVIYSYGIFMSRGRRAKQKRMNEISLNTIHRLEHYIEYVKNRLWVRLLGLILMLGALYAGYLYYFGDLPRPDVIPYQPYSAYGAVGLIVLIALTMMFRVRKTLYFTINSGANEKTLIKFDVNRYNETAIKYIASKIKSN